MRGRFLELGLGGLSGEAPTFCGNKRVKEAKEDDFNFPPLGVTLKRALKHGLKQKLWVGEPQGAVTTAQAPWLGKRSRDGAPSLD
ncbi:MAG: hypothetical protein EBR81_10290 [Proteobacteria bacterium]|nr:hypothetical protein [Pseudomonadota bacterium]